MIDAELIGRARDVDIAIAATSLGAVLRKASASERVGACLVCGGRDRFAVNTKKQAWHCRGCNQGGNAISLVQHVHNCSFRVAVDCLTDGRSMPASQARPKPPEPKPKDEDDNREKALALWREGTDPRVPVVKLYFLGRALELDDGLAGEILRWHPRIGAMLALFRNVLTGEPQAVSRTFLDREGKKLGRKFLGPVACAAVMLDAFDEVLEGLHISEGIETCMAARAFGLRPAWALGSAGAVAAFPVLSGVACLTLLQENDQASERACEACAARWHAAGREVLINQPIAGKDLNDAIQSSS
jgi:hypothetical protein